MEKYEPIIQFFQSIGAAHEAAMYLRLFKKGDPARFAVIQIDHKVLESTSVLGADLAYLSNLDLYPIVSQESGETDSRSVTKKSSALKEIVAVNKKITDSVIEHGGKARGLTGGVFELVPGPGREIIQVNEKLLKDTICHDAIPVVAPLAHMDSGKTLLLDAQEAIKALLLALEPKKYILLLKEEGIWNKQGHIVSLINVRGDNFHPPLTELTQKGAAITRRLSHLLLMSEESFMIEITSPQNLLRELFTIKGGGTLVKRGPKISLYKSYQELSKPKLKQLIETCFGRKLKARFFEEPISFLLLEESYKGVAIVRQMGEVFYLDKFAVRKESQGEGTGADLWEHLIQHCPRLVWRSKPKNPINDWYYERCSGMEKLGAWYVWWINVPRDQKQQVLDYALKLPESFQE